MIHMSNILVCSNKIRCISFSRGFSRTLSFSKTRANTALLYTISSIDGRGKIMVATKCLIPGQEILREENPILRFSENFEEHFTAPTSKPFADMLSSYNVFSKYISNENKIKVLDLFGPTDDLQAKTMRQLASQAKLIGASWLPELNSNEEVETFVKVASVFKYNAFKTSDAGRAIYEKISRVNHSCQPNCHIKFEGETVILRAVLPVKEGEELTIEYNEATSNQPTHARRRHYLLNKEFTCHCARCAATADDTRQFNCYDPHCTGSHFACQPLSNEPFYVAGTKTPSKVYNEYLKYTGVEYVQPYLLPCTVCSQPAPQQYQNDMFALEACLPRLTDQLETIREDLNIKCKYMGDASGDAGGDQQNKLTQQCNEVISRIVALPLPPYHRLSGPIFKIAMAVASYLPTEHSAERVNTALTYFQYLENLDKVVDDWLATDYFSVSKCLSASRVLYAQPIALYCARKALRMHLILNGRDCRSELLDSAVVDALYVVERTKGALGKMPKDPQFARYSAIIYDNCTSIENSSEISGVSGSISGSDSQEVQLNDDTETICVFCGECAGQQAAMSLFASSSTENRMHMFCSEGCKVGFAKWIHKVSVATAGKQ